MTIQRSSKGAIAFSSADQTGANIVIENTTSGARSKIEDISGWTIEKNQNGRVVFSIRINDKVTLQAGRSFTFWARGAKDKATSEYEQIADIFSFGTGSCTYRLLDERGNEKATLVAKYSG